MSEILDGKALAAHIKAELSKEVEKLGQRQITPGLAVVLVGDDPASQVYVRAKEKACLKIGVASFQHRLKSTTTQQELLALITDLNRDDRVHGILVQLPLPKHLNEEQITEAIDPSKDVDGFHPYNIGKLLIGEAIFHPCTPLGIIKLLESTGMDISGKEAVVVGRSNIVGKPVALMLLQKHATVTICHSRTVNLPETVGRADIVVAAVGRAEMVRGEWIKEGAVVIDVGINRTAEGKLLGDVAFAEASKRASFITPVPGGVGPMTIAMLLYNTVEAARQS